MVVLASLLDACGQESPTAYVAKDGCESSG
jgi:hypothetical protein